MERARLAGRRTVITVSWATANVINPINWLRLMVGNADPPGTGYVVASDSVSTTSWKRITHDLIAQTEQLSVGMGMDWDSPAAAIPVGWSNNTAVGDRSIMAITGVFFIAPGQFTGAMTVNAAHQHTITNQAVSVSSLSVSVSTPVTLSSTGTASGGTTGGPSGTDNTNTATGGGTHGDATSTHSHGQGAMSVSVSGSNTFGGTGTGTGSGVTNGATDFALPTLSILHPVYAAYPIKKVLQT